MTTGGWSDLFAPRVLMESVNNGMDVADLVADIVSFEYESTTKKMDKCVITLANENMKYANDPRFDREIRLRVKWGYPSGLSDLRTVVVVQIAPSISMGVPTLVLTAYDTGQDLAQTGARNWGAVPSSTIAREIARRHGLRAEVVNSNDARREHRTQSASTTDYEFLATLADRINYEFCVENNVLRYVPINTGASPSHRFVYFTDGTSILKSFSPSVKKAKIHRKDHGGVNAAGTPVQTAPRQTNRALARNRVQTINTRAAALGPMEDRGGVAVNDIYVAPSPETNDRVRQLQASSEQASAEMGSVNMTAELVGYPKINARDVIEIYVVDRRYSGLWRVESAKHSISPGSAYETKLKLKRAEVNANGAPAASVVPRNERNAAVDASSPTPLVGIDTPRAATFGTNTVDILVRRPR